MASKSRIQGITIELDGETSGLEKALKDVNKRSFELQSELRDVDKLLKFDPNNVEALAQKQKLLTEQIENTAEKLRKLKNAQEQVDQQFKSGDIGEKQYRAFRREIEFTEKSLKNLDAKLSQLDGANVTELKTEFSKLGENTENATKNVKSLAGEIGGLVAGAGAVKGIGEIVENSLDISSLNTKIDISFNVPDESKESIKEATRQVQNYGIDSEEALEGIRRQWALNSDATDEANQKTIKYASTITSAYAGVDFTEVIQESSELSKILGIGTDEAVALMDTLLELGFPPDQVDIIAEYGQQLQRMGYNAEEVMGLFAAGVATGTQNIDQLIDGVKEGRIVMSEFGAVVDEETSTLLSNIGISTEQFQTWGKAIAEGGDGGKQAMEQVAAAIAGIDDKTLQNQIGTKIWGTLFEEQGTKITDTILGVNDHMLDMGGMIDVINEKTDTMDKDPTVRMRKALSDLTVVLTPLLEIIADVIGNISNWVSENKTLAAIIIAVASAIGIIVGIFAALAPIFTAISSLAGILGVSIGAIAGPVLLVVGIIAGLIAIGVALWKNWDEIKAKCTEIWTAITNFLSNTWENIKTSISNAWEGIKNFFIDNWDKILSIFFGPIGILVSFIIKNWDEIKSVSINIWNSITSFLSNIANNILSAITNKFISIKNSIANTFSSVKDVISNIWNNILNFFNNIDLYSIGKNIIQGLINGVLSMAKNVVNSVKNVVDGAIKGAKNLLGIHSPSRVFMEFGEYTGEGFINGMSAMKKEVAKAGQSMANASIPNINIPDFKGSLSNEPGIVYLTNETYLDGKLIGSETTKRVLNNMNRSTNNYKIGKGGLGFA